MDTSTEPTVEQLLGAAGDPPPAADPTPAATEPTGDPFDAPETTTFDRGYVERLRKESASYRTKAKELEDRYSTLNQYDEQDRAVWLQLAQTYMTDEKAAAAEMKRLAEHILGGEQPAGEPEPEVPLTVAEFEKRWNEKEEAKAHAAAVRSIQAEAEELGYTKDTRAYKVLLLTAKEETNGDLKAAHAALLAERQSAIDEYVGAKAREADGSPKPPGGAGVAPSGSREIKTWADASKALTEHLAAQDW